MFKWISQNFKDLENVSPSWSLSFSLIDDVKDLLFHHLLLIARHYIYTCRLENKLPKLQVYIQVLMNSIEIGKQIAFHNNDSNVFVRKWSLRYIKEWISFYLGVVYLENHTCGRLLS